MPAQKYGGLSPLARGNRTREKAQLPPLRPIPARAGQPGQSSAPLRATWAYPRSRGATCLIPRNSSIASGLSPLARGNPGTGAGIEASFGPIPARAGQPPITLAGEVDAGAYPRSRGATAERVQTNCCCTGLSPLARGNQVAHV